MVSPSLSKPGPTSDADAASCSIEALPCALLAKVLQHLPQRQRAAAALVCSRWAAVVRTSPALFRHITLSLSVNTPHCVERTEWFLAWLVPRAVHVQQLTVAARRSTAAADAAPTNLLQLCWANVVAALSVLGPHLQTLSLEWPDELTVSAWAASLTALQTATLKASRITVRRGLHTLINLRDIRLRSTAAPVTFVPASLSSSSSGGASTGLLLPAGLRKARLEGCHLTALPPPVLALRQLEDLVLSDNVLKDADLQGLSRLTSLRSLTLMGCRMRRLPAALSTLTSLQCLYLDMGLEAPVGDVPPAHVQCCEALAPLSRLAILSLGACHLEEFPLTLTQLTALRALYLDDNTVVTLPDGPYLRGLHVLGCDWRCMFQSHQQLAHAPHLTKLCLMCPGKGIDSVPHGPDAVAAVVQSIRGHPRLRTLLLPMLDGQRSAQYVATFNVMIGLAQARHLDMKAVTYQHIGNEWLEWLEGLEKECGPESGIEFGSK